mmetsp:Transcript_10489/g.12170  ORF Transcript_10489/g.12170 Transcript_10489/m.12170 type:complete len:351 (-) Transcript_10489:115-1167(-)
MTMNTNNPRSLEISYLAFNFFSTIAVTFINKICFSRVSFGFPAALCNIHFLMTYIGVEMMRRLGFFEKKKGLIMSIHDPNFLCLVIVVGLVTPLNNTSLKLNSVGFYQIFKLLVTPGVVMLEYVLDQKTLSIQRTLSLVAVCMFVLVSSRADLEFSTYGTLCAILWVPLAALYKVQWGRVRKQYSCSTLQLMHTVLPYAMIVQALISPLVDPPGLTSFQWTTEAIFWIGLSGIAAFLVNFSGFLVMGNIGALAHVLLGQLKTAVIMIGSSFIFESHYSNLQIVGALGAIGSIILYTRVTLSEKENNMKSDVDVLTSMPSSSVSSSGYKEVLPLTINDDMDMNISSSYTVK